MDDDEPIDLWLTPKGELEAAYQDALDVIAASQSDR